jgi:predicted anti-sigma-YlaC factor YlaD
MDFLMKCHNVQKKLSAYQDRELKHREEQEVSKHLLGCQSCRMEYEKLERIWQTLGEFEQIQPDPWFYTQLVRKIKQPREEELLPTLQHVFQLFHVPVTVSVILVVGLLVGTYLGSILARRDLFPFRNESVSDSQGAFFASLRVFDPAPPGTLAHGYLQMVNYEERGSR